MEKFNLFFKDSFLGTLGYDKQTDTYKFVKSNADKWFPPEFSINKFLGLPKEYSTETDAREFVKDRVYPKERQLLEVYLEKLDLGGWDAWEIFVRCSGMFQLDHYWIDSYGVTCYDNRERRMGDFINRRRESTHPELFLF